MPDFKVCHFCKESDVKYLAEVCKHCGKDPDGSDGKKVRLRTSKLAIDEQQQQIKDKKKWEGVSLIQWLGGFIVTAGIIYLVGATLVHQYRIGKKELAEEERAKIIKQKQDTD